MADDSHEMSRLIFQEKQMKRIYLKMSSAATVIGALRVKLFFSSNFSQEIKKVHVDCFFQVVKKIAEFTLGIGTSRT